MTKNDGGPAFPELMVDHVTMGGAGEALPIYRMTSGMTLRDYFAAQALAGMLANTEFLDRRNGETKDFPFDTARNAYFLADAMLTERAKDAK